MALAAAFVTWLVVEGDDEPPRPPAPRPALASHVELVRLADSLQVPLHWAGPRAGFRYELTRTETSVFVRYLPGGVEPGDRKPAFLIVGTYIQDDGFAAVRAGSRRRGAVAMELPGGGLATYDRKRPTSVYFSYPGAGYQVEVYHPDGSTARRLVASGQVTAVATPPRTGVPAIVSERQLRDLATFLDLDIHWAGARPRFRYELTQIAEGHVFVRYLPPGVRVGDPRAAFLTVATYAEDDGFAAVRAGSRRRSAVAIHLPGRGLAVYDRKRTASVYFSYPGADYQVEVFAPDGDVARQLVVSGQVEPIR
jgi:hypothetical protein